MFTPASVVAIGNSRCVTSRAEPPSVRRLCASENEKRRFGIVPESVLGGVKRSGLSCSRLTLCSGESSRVVTRLVLSYRGQPPPPASTDGVLPEPERITVDPLG